MRGRRSWPIAVASERRSSATGATQVILADAASLNGQLRSVMDACSEGGVALKVVSLGLHRHPDVVTYIPGLDCPLFVVRPQPAGPGSYLVKQIGDRVGSALVLVVLEPLDPPHRAADQADLPRARVLRGGAHRRGPAAVSLLQVPHHGGERP